MAGGTAAPVARGVRRGRFTVTRLHHSGAAPHRILLLGSRAVLAPRGRALAEALGQRITDRVFLLTHRGVDLDMLWELRPVLSAIRTGLASWRLWRYDAVVVVTVLRAPTPLARWRSRSVHALLTRVVGEVSPTTRVLLVALGDGRERGRRRTDGGPVLGDEEPSDDPRVSSLSTSFDEREAAEAVAQRLLGPLAAADAASGSDDEEHRWADPADEEARQRAVDGLDLHDRRVEQRLQHVVDLARESFECAAAEITVIDRDRQWTLAAHGRKHEEAPRETSLCDRAIRRADATVILDTWRVPELRGNPLVSGGSGIRFYAAHPIESVDGHRIGALCVWDDVPHLDDDVDVTALRDLALLAEAEIIGAARER